MKITDEMVERAARVLAGIEPGEDWPSNQDLGGNATGTRDDEYRDGMRDIARAVLEAALTEDDTHDFLPVAGHPDDPECSYRSNGTDAKYCGELLEHPVHGAEDDTEWEPVPDEEPAVVDDIDVDALIEEARTRADLADADVRSAMRDTGFIITRLAVALGKLRDERDDAFAAGFEQVRRRCEAAERERDEALAVIERAKAAAPKLAPSRRRRPRALSARRGSSARIIRSSPRCSDSPKHGACAGFSFDADDVEVPCPCEVAKHG